METTFIVITMIVTILLSVLLIFLFTMLIVSARHCYKTWGEIVRHIWPAALCVLFTEAFLIWVSLVLNGFI